MAGLEDLFKFKDELTIISPKTGKKTNKKVWVRLMGDRDTKEAYAEARIVSAAKRAELRDEESVGYKTAVAQLQELSTQDIKDLILAEAENGFIREAPVIVEREELPEIADIAAEPDAPSLEEQEVLDKKTEDQEKRFIDSINDYVNTKRAELGAELDALPDDELLKRAIKTLQNIQPLQAFAEELDDQKGFRSTFVDKECKIKAFPDIESFRDSHTSVKQQILEKYNQLDMSIEDLKE